MVTTETELDRLADDGCPLPPADPLGMTDAEKARAFDLIAAAMVRRVPWQDGRQAREGGAYVACPGSTPGMALRATPAEAAADLILWAAKVVARRQPAPQDPR